MGNLQENAPEAEFRGSTLAISKRIQVGWETAPDFGSADEQQMMMNKMLPALQGGMECL